MSFEFIQMGVKQEPGEELAADEYSDDDDYIGDFENANNLLEINSIVKVESSFIDDPAADYAKNESTIDHDHKTDEKLRRLRFYI